MRPALDLSHFFWRMRKKTGPAGRPMWLKAEGAIPSRTEFLFFREFDEADLLEPGHGRLTILVPTPFLIVVHDGIF